MSRSKSSPAINVLITGTPGTGKTTLAGLVAERTDMNHIDISALVKEKELYEEWDEEYSSYVIDEDKVCDELEETMSKGFNVVDHHGCDWFPERWFQLVVVLRTDNTTLYDRLVDRGYEKQKLEDNIEAEIMRVILDEAMESYDEKIIWELDSNSIEDMENNADRIVDWVKDNS